MRKTPILSVLLCVALSLILAGCGLGQTYCGQADLPAGEDTLQLVGGRSRFLGQVLVRHGAGCCANPICFRAGR